LLFAQDNNLRGAKTLENLPVDIAGIDSLLIQGAWAHWNHVRGDKFAPTLVEFKLEDLDPSIIPHITIADFEGPPFDYRYRFFGTKVVEIAGMELTGKSYYADNIEGFGFANAQEYPAMIEKRKPAATRTVWLSVKSLRYTATTLRLPLSADTKTVTGGVTVYHFE